MARRPAFALVIVLFLMAMMAAAGASLGFMASTESLLCRYAANDLDHHLAMDSLLAALPSLSKTQLDETAIRAAPIDERRYAITVGGVRVRCALRSESSKTAISANDSDGAASQLRQIAQDNGLSPESVVLRTIAKDDPYAARLAPIQWFDQLIEQREFEEVLPWRLDRDPDVYGPGRKTWSDVISLWPGRNTKSLLVETAIGSDSRNWFLIVRLGEAYVEVLYRGRV